MSSNLLLASTSTLYGGDYLAYLLEELSVLFKDAREIVFVPYARPSGISLVDYTAKAAAAFSQINKGVRGIHTFVDMPDAIANAEAIFVGGGNTFLLVKSLYDLDLMMPLRAACMYGVPYLGCSAGTNIAGLSMQTTNDMPIVFPPSYETLGLVPFNINPHYLDPIKNLKHNGETRETRILEFLSQNETPVVGLREGSWLRVQKNKIHLSGELTARIFERNKSPYELSAGSNLFE